MATLPVITTLIDDVVVVGNAEDTTISLFNHFDDPLTTGLVARFELYDTSLSGGITNVVLFDQADQGADLTVANFLNYVNDGDYVNTIIHRSVPGFIIQGGGFTANGLATAPTPASAIAVIPTNPPVQNEFSANRSNTRGTIAMAKVNNNPNSATNQWFFNLADNNDINNPFNLDNQNGGFTVFGEVISQSDLDVLDAIAAVPTFNRTTVFQQGAFTNIPLIFENPSNPTLTGDENFVRYKSITVSQQDELQFTVINNSNPSLVNPTISNNALLLDYLPGQIGTAQITVRATNLLGDTVEDTFVVTVDNTPPTTTGIGNIIVDEDANNSIINLFDAFADLQDSDVELTYAIANNSNPLLLTNTPINSTTGELTLDFAPDINGQTNITIRAQDTQGEFVETTFTVTVNPVNDNPVAENDNG
ncbi:peptidylprolyl isomerase, partial [Cronbergia sp. UHCC 0137]|uniref:peptidylprolyl isomerase n=1 Tax=Cronbergia sp. UHCC 0137 TaxID=3110239 RepID=UPI002B20BC3B